MKSEVFAIPVYGGV